MTNPWDTNSSLPAEANNTTAGSTPTVSGVSTTHAADLLIAIHAGSMPAHQSRRGVEQLSSCWVLLRC